MSGWVLAEVLQAALAPATMSAAVGFFFRRAGYRWPFCAGWFCASVNCCVAEAAAQDLLALCIAGANALLAAFFWWRRRLGRGPRAAGARTKAILARMVRKMRESAVPRLVPEPTRCVPLLGKEARR